MKKWADGIKGIDYVWTAGKSPAAVHRETGVIYINVRLWHSIPPAHRVFILLHEWAHVKLKSDNEEKVDALAFQEYAKLGYPLSNAIHALTRILSFSGKMREEHLRRANAQLSRAKAYDEKYNGNSF